MATGEGGTMERAAEAGRAPRVAGRGSDAVLTARTAPGLSPALILTCPATPGVPSSPPRRATPAPGPRGAHRRIRATAASGRGPASPPWSRSTSDARGQQRCTRRALSHSRTQTYWAGPLAGGETAWVRGSPSQVPGPPEAAGFSVGVCQHPRAMCPPSRSWGSGDRTCHRGLAFGVTSLGSTTVLRGLKINAVIFV